MASEKDTLETVASKINALTAKIDKATGDMRNYRATRNALIVEAHGRVMGDGWEKWVEANLTLSYRAAYKIVAKLAPPKLQQENAEQVQQNEPVENPVATREITNYVAQPKVPAEPPSVEERAKPLVAAWFNASEDERAYFLSWAKLRPVHPAIADALQAKLAAPKDTPRRVEVKSPPVVIPAAVEALMRRFVDIPSKQMWIEQRFADIKQGIKLELKGQGDVSYQIIRDYQAMPIPEQEMVDAKIVSLKSRS